MIHYDEEADGKAFLSVKSVARRYDVATTTVWLWARTGKLPRPVKINGRTRWHLGQLRGWEPECKAGDGVCVPGEVL